MRFILGIIVGFALTVGGAYLADMNASRPIVNWDVVSKDVSTLIGLAHDGWRKITG